MSARWPARFVTVLVWMLVAAACANTTDASAPPAGGLAGSTAIASDEPATTSPAAVDGVVPSADTDRATSEAPSSNSSTTDAPTTAPPTTLPPLVRTGAGRLVDTDFEAIAGRRVGLIANQTSVVDGVHLIDRLDDHPDVELVAAFAPEHGIRGIADAGEVFDDEFDPRTGTVVFSLYGATRRPTAEMLEGIDVLVFDLQDVGTRFYTYISTMGLAMQAAAEAGIPFIVLDRPNPLGGDATSGFVRDADIDSFIAQYPIPSAFGLTSGELALAIKGEGWMTGLESLDLTVIEMDGWDRSMRWDDTELEWIGPSPGLPTVQATLVYPGSVLIEATVLNYGTGSERPFTAVGHTWLDGDRLTADIQALDLPGATFESIRYTPRVIPNVSSRPRLEGENLGGMAITVTDPATYRPIETMLHVIVAVQRQADEAGEGSIIDRPAVFDLLAGSPRLRRALEAGTPVEEIVTSWQAEVEAFDLLVAPYRLHS